MCYVILTVSDKKGRHTKLKKKISIWLVGILMAVTICLSLSEGMHREHDCYQEYCVFCIEIKQLKIIMSQMRTESTAGILICCILSANMAYLFITKQEQPSLVKWKVRMDH